MNGRQVVVVVWWCGVGVTSTLDQCSFGRWREQVCLLVRVRECPRVCVGVVLWSGTLCLPWHVSSLTTASTDRPHAGVSSRRGR